MSWSSIKRVLTLSCEESSRLVSESLDRSLPAGERWAVRLHVLCCTSCRRYARQLGFLSKAVRGIGDAEDAAYGDATLSSEARAHFKSVLQQESTEEKS